jgi:hypothetical protein
MKPKKWFDAARESATHLNGLPPLPAALSNTWTINACAQEAACIAGTIRVALYFPPDFSPSRCKHFPTGRNGGRGARIATFHAHNENYFFPDAMA